MQMNGDLNISFEVIAHSSCFPLLGCCHILLCILSIVTDESIEFQVNRVDTCFRVVGVFLSAPKGLFLGMHLYFLGLFYRELGFWIALFFSLWNGTNLGICRGENGELRVGVRRAMRQQGNVPSSVISSHSMHLGVLATAWHAILTGTIFTVYYKPRFVNYS